MQAYVWRQIFSSYRGYKGWKQEAGFHFGFPEGCVCFGSKEGRE